MTNQTVQEETLKDYLEVLDQEFGGVENINDILNNLKSDFMVFNPAVDILIVKSFRVRFYRQTKKLTVWTHCPSDITEKLLEDGAYLMSIKDKLEELILAVPGVMETKQLRLTFETAF